MTMQNEYSIYRWWVRHVYNGFLFNALRVLRRRPVAEEPLEKLATLNDFKKILSRHRFVVTDTIFYNVNVWLMPLDRWFPNLSALTSKRLEFLAQSIFGFFLGADFLIKVQKVISDLEIASATLL
jgi:hypothetical protein